MRHYSKRISRRVGTRRGRSLCARGAHPSRNREARQRRVSEFRARNDASNTKYPTRAAIVKLNKHIIETIRVSKNDRHLLFRDPKDIDTVIEKVKLYPGDTYDKAAELLIQLNGEHIFQSANKRTSYAAALGFLDENGAGVREVDPAESSKVMKGVREGFYTHEEVKAWLKGNGIRPFKPSWERRR